MIKNIRHSGIVVRDIIESYNFYVDLGFMIESDEIEKGKSVPMETFGVYTSNRTTVKRN